MGRPRKHWRQIDSGQGLEVWDTAEAWRMPVIAAPLERVAQLLDEPLEAIQEAARAVEPYERVDGTPVWSVHLLAVQLGLRLSRRQRARKRQGLPV